MRIKAQASIQPISNIKHQNFGFKHSNMTITNINQLQNKLSLVKSTTNIQNQLINFTENNLVGLSNDKRMSSYLSGSGQHSTDKKSFRSNDNTRININTSFQRADLLESKAVQTSQKSTLKMENNTSTFDTPYDSAPNRTAIGSAQ
jgi:hypothetical protein